MRLDARVCVNHSDECFQVAVGEGRQTVLWLALNVAGRCSNADLPKGRIRQREPKQEQKAARKRGQLVPTDVQVNGISVDPNATILQVLRNLRKDNPLAHSLDLALHGDYELVSLKVGDESKCPERKNGEGKRCEDEEGEGAGFHQHDQHQSSTSQGNGKMRIVDLAKQVVFHISLADEMRCSALGTPDLQHTQWRDLAFGHSKASQERIEAVRADKLRQKADIVRARQRKEEEANRILFMEEIEEEAEHDSEGNTLLAFYGPNSSDDLGQTAKIDYKFLRTKIEKLGLHQDEATSVCKTVLSHYRLLRNTFKYYSGADAAMSYNEFTRVALCMGIIEARDLDLVANIVLDSFQLPSCLRDKAQSDSDDDEPLQQDKNGGDFGDLVDDYNDGEIKDSYTNEEKESDGDSSGFSSSGSEYSGDEAGSTFGDDESFVTDDEQDFQSDGESKGSEGILNTSTSKSAAGAKSKQRLKQSNISALLSKGYVRRLDFFECIMRLFLSKQMHNKLQSRPAIMEAFAQSPGPVDKASARFEKYMSLFVVPALESKTHTRGVRKALEDEQVLLVFANKVKALKKLFVELCGVLSAKARRKGQSQNVGVFRDNGRPDSDQGDADSKSGPDEIGQREFSLLLQGASLIDLNSLEAAEQNSSRGNGKLAKNKGPQGLRTRQRRNSSNMGRDPGNSKNSEEKSDGSLTVESWRNSASFLNGRIEKAKLTKLSLADSNGLFTISQFEDEDQVGNTEGADDNAESSEPMELSFKEFVGTIVRLSFMIFGEHYASHETVSLLEKVHFTTEILLRCVDWHEVALGAMTLVD